jgi:hypothetical protein
MPSQPRRVYYSVTVSSGRSQWSRCLRRGSVPTCLLGSWVRIPPEHACLSLVDAVCCLVEVSATGRSLAQGSHTDCSVFACDSEASKMGRSWLTRGCRITKKKPLPRWTQTNKHTNIHTYIHTYVQTLRTGFCM